MTAYELWRERETGEVWAVRLVDGVVVGCCGPLPARERVPAFLGGLDYTSDRARWVDVHRDAFELAHEAAELL